MNFSFRYKIFEIRVREKKKVRSRSYAPKNAQLQLLRHNSNMHKGMRK